MEYKEKLFSQINDTHGKLVYTYTTHLKQADIYVKVLRTIKIVEIVLCTLTATGLFGYFITDSNWLTKLSAITATFSLGVTLFKSQMNIEEKIYKHRATADELWIIREEYISLMTDFFELPDEQIRNQRDVLMHKTSKIYKVALPTSKKSYSQAQEALQKKEEQYFSETELKQLNPAHLR